MFSERYVAQNGLAGNPMLNFSNQSVYVKITDQAIIFLSFRRIDNHIL